MKRNIILSIALVLSIVLVLLTGSDSPVTAQNQTRYSADTGVITLGQNQILRVTINGGSGDDAIAVRFRQTRYMQTGCDGGVCKFAVESQTTSPQMISAPNQSSKLDVMANQIGPDAAVRAEVLSSSRNMQVNVMIVDKFTGEILSIDKSTPKLLESSN